VKVIGVWLLIDFVFLFWWWKWGADGVREKVREDDMKPVRKYAEDLCAELGLAEGPCEIIEKAMHELLNDSKKAQQSKICGERKGVVRAEGAYPMKHGGNEDNG
jgi:hypothetical protein